MTISSLKHNHIWHLLSVVAVGIALRIALFSGYDASDLEFFDDSIYVTNAFEMAEGRTTPQWSHWQARLGMTGTLAVVLNTFPRSTLSVVALPFLWSIVGIPLAYAIGRHFYNDHCIALMGSLFVAVIPLHVIMASLYMPEMGLAALLGVALLSFSAAEARGRTLLFLVAGLALGFAYLYRETALFALLPTLIYCLYSRQLRVGYLVAASGFLVVLAFEALTANFLWNDPLYRFHILVKYSVGATGLFPKIPIRPGGVLLSPILSLLTNEEHGLFYFFVVWAIFGLVWKRDKLSAPLLLFVLPVAIYTLWGTVSPKIYAPLWPEPRYMSSITIPAALLLARWLFAYCGPFIGRASVAVLVVSSLVCAYLDNDHTVHSLGVALCQVREENRMATLVVPATAYMHLFMASGLQPPKNVELLGKDGSPSALKVDPSLTVRTEENELSGCLVAVAISSKKPVRPEWQYRSQCLRTRRWFARYLDAAGGIFTRLGEKLEPTQGFDIYYVPASGQH